MKAKLTSMIIENFKGCKHGEYNFTDKTRISGRNGAGKSTIADAFYWVLADCDSCLKNNPPIFPVDGSECKPSVTLTFDFDGTEVTAQKTQTRVIKSDKDTGKVSESYTNNYAVNSIEYGLRDFMKKLSEYGFDSEKFLQLSHPDVFLAGMNDKKKREAIRNTLFQMAQSFTDLEVAQVVDRNSDVSRLLEKYSMAEISAMQKNNLKKISDILGKDGSKIDAEMAGLESAKVDYEVGDLELLKSVLKKDLAEVELQLKLGSMTAIDELQDKRLKLVFDSNDIRRRATENVHNTRHKLSQKAVESDMAIETLSREIKSILDVLMKDTQAFEDNTAEIEKMKPEYKRLKESSFNDAEWVFDESKQVCQMCGQALPKGQIEERKKTFEANKAKAMETFKTDRDSALAKIKDKGNGLAAENKSLKEKILFNENVVAEKNAKLKEMQLENKAIKEKLRAVPAEPDMSKDAEYVKLQKEIEGIDKEIKEISENKVDTVELERKKEDIHFQLTDIERKLTLSARNAELDEKIEELRLRKVTLAQQKADCEAIIDQLTEVEQKKNEMLQASINEHFTLVKWQLWGKQKNGEILTDVCTPTINGKDFTTAVNTGLQIAGRVDIINGLQTFFKQYYPVFLDGAEALDTIGQDSIATDAQLIMLIVADGELKVG